MAIDSSPLPDAVDIGSLIMKITQQHRHRRHREAEIYQKKIVDMSKIENVVSVNAGNRRIT